jgi:hypothetical protein
MFVRFRHRRGSHSGRAGGPVRAVVAGGPVRAVVAGGAGAGCGGGQADTGFDGARHLPYGQILDRVAILAPPRRPARLCMTSDTAWRFTCAGTAPEPTRTLLPAIGWSGADRDFTALLARSTNMN